MRICERKLCNGVPLRECQFSLFQFQFELSNSIFIGVIIKKKTHTVALNQKCQYKVHKSESIERKKAWCYTKNYYLFKKKSCFSLLQKSRIGLSIFELIWFGLYAFSWWISVLFRFVRVINYLVFSCLISFISDFLSKKFISQLQFLWVIKLRFSLSMCK